MGGEGLGNWAITYGYRQYNEIVTWMALVVIIIIVQLVQALGNMLARKVMRH